jgi:hypothetical protein
MCTPAPDNPCRHHIAPNILFDVFYCKSYLEDLNCKLCNPTTTASFLWAHSQWHQLHDVHGPPWVQILNTWHTSSQVWFAMAYSGCGRRRSCPDIVGPFLRLFCSQKKTSHIIFLQMLMFVSQNHIHHRRWKFVIMRHVFWTTLSVLQSMFVRTTNQTQKLTKISI